MVVPVTSRAVLGKNRQFQNFDAKSNKSGLISVSSNDVVHVNDESLDERHTSKQTISDKNLERKFPVKETTTGAQRLFEVPSLMTAK